MSDTGPGPQLVAIPLWMLAVIAVLLFLREAATLLIPIVLAILISYTLEPIVGWLDLRRIPRAAGTALTVVVLLGGFGWAGYALSDETQRVLDSLPQAAQRAREFVGNAIGDVAAPAQAQADHALNVTATLAQWAAESLFALAGHTIVIVFLVFFLLVAGPHARNRIVEIAGPDREGRQTAAEIIDDINRQIQRFLLVRLATATVVALLTWAVLAWMNGANAAISGILAGAFNSIPYFGPVIVSGGLLVVGLVQSGGVMPALQMSGAALAITSLEGWLLTPPLIGKAERMSALAVFLGLLLWTWLWGAWGTLLAVPMLVVLKSIADHVERMNPIGRLMAP